MPESPFTPSMKIDLMESMATMPISIAIGFTIGLIGNMLAWPLLIMLSVTAAVVVIFLYTPLPGMIRGWVRRKAESHYYGT